MKYKNIIKNEPKFNGAYSRNSLPEIKDGAYACAISLDEFKSIGTPWLDLYVNGSDVLYFDRFKL